MATFHFHRFGRFFYAHGAEASARSYLTRLNHRLTSNLWAMRAEGDRPRGIDLAAELAKGTAQTFS